MLLVSSYPDFKFELKIWKKFQSTQLMISTSILIDVKNKQEENGYEKVYIR